jgi:23S rRNA (uracil1939-C5)-methyltransferase
MIRKVKIDDLGGRGDGIVHEDGNLIYVPYSAPGDMVDIKLTGAKGRIKHIHQKSQHRVDAICTHFTKCGGCTLQHIKTDYYKTWKEGFINTALSNQGISDAVINPIEISPLGSRRRTTLQAVCRSTGDVILGYAEKGSHNLIDVEMCPILMPEIVKFIAPQRAFLAKIMTKKQKMTVQVTCGENGLDVIIEGMGEAGLKLRMDLAEFAVQNDLARVSWLDRSLKNTYFETLAERRKPYVTFNGNKVFFPVGSFLQATVEGQNLLTKVMLDGIVGANWVVDLFSGCGTFSIAASRVANVHAVENNEEMLTALKNSANLMTGIKQVSTELRDLFLRPLLPHELNEFDVAIIDPPRAGAKQQMQEILNSDIKKLVMVSCNPVTFARDVQNLVTSGFKMGPVTPVDQFLFSPHLEIISVFERS